MPHVKKILIGRRLNLELSVTVRERLESLRDETEADSLTEVIRRSLAVYEFLWDEKKKGGELIIRTEKSERELVLL